MFLCVYVFCIHLSSLFLRRGELLLMGFVGVAGVGGGGGGLSFSFLSYHPFLLTAPHSKDTDNWSSQQVRVWTLRGAFVGHCGEPWVKLPSIRLAKPPLRVLPSDIRRSASARTFRVIKAGCVPLWIRCLQVVKNYLEECRKEEMRKVACTFPYLYVDTVVLNSLTAWLCM